MLRTIVIVGGGFSGTVLAANLLRRPPPGPTRLVLIERADEVGRGAAYAKRAFPYLLNVPASRMSANSAAPNEFLEFARRRMPKASGEGFLPRPLYGEYLGEVLLAAQLSAPTNIRLEIVKGSVVNLRRLERHVPLQVELEDGRRFTADDVVLALGNPKPASLAAARDVLTHPAYVADPWAVDLKFNRDQTVLLIGTGLTAADIINVASADPQRVPTLHALSRHGLVPPRQTPFRPDAFNGDGNALLLAASTSLRRLTSSVRLLAHEAERMGGDWREAITFVRNMAPTIWQRLPERDRVRFLRHVRAHWDIHRHRLPPEMNQKIETLRNVQRLTIHAGHIKEIVPRGDRIELIWRPRGQQRMRAQQFDRVINCTGPDYAIARSSDPLWRSLLQCGLCVPDSLGLGLRTGPNGAVIDVDGWPGPHLFYVGPMLRADHWEATAAHELRGHAEKLAALLAMERR
ncbi:FAD/NAD(P)-binding protein [Steroidobacter sp. S1-65]|uniref:FAD/NAD(P)-binding protein n=1 Tax=Steroidobacter gossypii TaxID=2805490 RepID=A0ABS1WTI5_9GAMM|nr:FAD/NAD(P)-binding protein [Steroidobacter gossypii]MBM0104291.1 FAD/NAD(P)-binding protein [Steroidobacter gossypii]